MMLSAGFMLLALVGAVFLIRRGDLYMAGVVSTIAAYLAVELLLEAMEYWHVEARLRWLRRWAARKRLARQTK